jgi:hypothetical protein
MPDVDSNGEENVAVEEPKTVHVRVADKDIDIDLSSGDYVKLEGSGAYAYVRKDYADIAKQSGEVEEDKDLRPVKPRKAYNTIYVPILAIRFIGTSTFVDITTTVNGQEVVEHAQYVRPIAYHAPAVMNAMGVLRGITERGVPWVAVVIAYPPGKPAKVLFVKSIRAYYRRYRTNSGVKVMPEVRFLFTKQIIGGLKKKTGYLFDFIVFAVQQQQVQKPKAKAGAEAEEEVEEEEVEPEEKPKPKEEEPKPKKAKSVKYSGVRELMIPSSTPAIYFVPVGGANVGQEPNSELTPAGSGGGGSAEGQQGGQQEGQQSSFNYVYESAGKFVKRQVEIGSIGLEPEDNALEAYHSLAVESGTSRYVQRADNPLATAFKELEEAPKRVRKLNL